MLSRSAIATYNGEATGGDPSGRHAHGGSGVSQRADAVCRSRPANVSEVRLMGRAGMTIIELVVVLLITAAMAAVAGPSISASFRRTATRVAADEFVTTHALARSVAARYGRIAELHINPSTHRVWVEVDTSAGGGVKDTVGVVKYLADGTVTIVSDRTILCFDARGLPSTRGSCEPADATLTFSRDGTADTVTITALGEVRR